jgi:Glycosyl hydrolases family 2, sugar binding domain.
MKYLQTKTRIGLSLMLPLGMFFLFSFTQNKLDTNSFSNIEKGFKHIPDSVQTSVYWYWISDNISKEGVVKDLEAMKQVGINRAFIGNVGLPTNAQPYGNIKFYSEEWWDILHTALKTATRLNIEIGLFNSPGWSQSGGPWIEPDQAMRYLASTSVKIKGGHQINKILSKPQGDFQDVKVIAFPSIDSGQDLISLENTQVTSTPDLSGISALIDGNKNTEIVLSGDQIKEITLDFYVNKLFTLRSVKIYPSHQSINFPAKIQVKDNGEYTTLAAFRIDRFYNDLSVGFDPYSPIVISVPETHTQDIRIIVSEINTNSGIKEIELSSIPAIERYPEKTLAKMFQTPLPYWNEYQWESQPVVEDPSLVVDPAKVLDLTKYLSGDQLIWDAPEGDWTILRTGMLPTGVTNAPATPEATGMEADKMSKKHIRTHFEAFMGEIYRRIPAKDRKCWKMVVQDSYETGGQNFTDGFLADFKKRYGYDPLPFLPAYYGIVVKSQDVSDRFLWDLRRLIADKIAYDYVGGLKEVSHEYGLKTWLENYGHWGFPGEFLQYGGQSDEIGGEFWSEGFLGEIENKAASSSAHIYGKRKVSAESFTSAGNHFSRYPSVIKKRGDRFFTEGINNTLLHVYIQQPYENKNPGMNAAFGLEVNRKNTWFKDIDMFVQYLKRCNLMLQQGNYVADVAYYIGDDAPKMTGVCDPALPEGYSFDYINSEVIEKYMTVQDGYLTLPDGMKYRVLVLPQLKTMRPEFLRKINKLVHEGAIVLGPAPERSPSLENYPASDKEIQQLASSLWRDVNGINIKYAKTGKGMILSGMQMPEVFNLIGLKPDCKTDKNTPVLFIHRTLPEGEIYFISNQSEEEITFSADFRVTGKQPEIWDPVFGTTRHLAAYSPKNELITVPLKLAGSENTFIVFRNPSNQFTPGDVNVNFPPAKTLLTISSSWTVSFDPKQRGPVSPVVMDKLQDWTKFSNDSIKYYSGTATYKTAFELKELPSKQQIFLNLGTLTATAKIRVNGKTVGGVWTAPWQTDISKAIKKGKIH